MFRHDGIRLFSGVGNHLRQVVFLERVFPLLRRGVRCTGVPGLQRDYRNRERFPFSIACQTEAPTESRLDGGGVALMATGYRFHQSTAVEPA